MAIKLKSCNVRVQQIFHLEVFDSRATCVLRFSLEQGLEESLIMAFQFSTVAIEVSLNCYFFILWCIVNQWAKSELVQPFIKCKYSKNCFFFISSKRSSTIICTVKAQQIRCYKYCVQNWPLSYVKEYTINHILNVLRGFFSRIDPLKCLKCNWVKYWEGIFKCNKMRRGDFTVARFPFFRPQKNVSAGK